MSKLKKKAVICIGIVTLIVSLNLTSNLGHIIGSHDENCLAEIYEVYEMYYVLRCIKKGEFDKIRNKYEKSIESSLEYLDPKEGIIDLLLKEDVMSSISALIGTHEDYPSSLYHCKTVKTCTNILETIENEYRMFKEEKT